jgi:NAD(P)H-quinone oxidoreductase subunit 6
MSESAKIILLLGQILTVVSAAVVALHPNILHASVGLLFTFMGVAVLFLFAGADFVAGTQIVVYAGGVTILILFAIMLTQWLYKVKLRDYGARLLVPALVAIGFFVFIYRSTSELGAWALKAAPAEQVEKFAFTPKTAVIGQAFLTNYLLPFEAVTILLLGALVGAVWLARPK